MNKRPIGKIEIARVFEMEFHMPAREFFPDTHEEDWLPHRDWLVDEGALVRESESIVLPMQSYVVQTSHHTILVDTCVGNNKQRPNRPTWHQKTDTTYIDNLAAFGLTPQDIDIVMCTHLHHDHVGWNTQLVDGRWVPTFPNAKYLMSKKELEVFSEHDDPAATPSLGDSVLPVVESGQAQLISSDFVLDDEVWLEPTPGHTPDHFAVRLQSGNHHAVIGGDLMHSPVQCMHPEWRARPDWDPELARKTRRAFMETHADLQSLVCMMHFPLPSAGKFERKGELFKFKYDEVDW
jgi:glyoxylase-like metal-dependent hydrolase (beta-lactamase superfamily II)